ncbi:sensor histidine kinase [Actinoplanes sp. G11-F43]|uniref:sensor histidine kinase n=1 Tax=Actinoplanes sp. G11-F43 TaxID=3424130 RepID=UPI003D3560B2
MFGAGAAGAAAALLVLRVTGPPSLLAAIGACALWSLPAAGAAAVGLHLRGQDRRRDRAAGEALRGQRLSLARDLHDYVAHDVSEMLATAQAGRVAGGDPATAAVLFERIEQAGQHALATLDRTVHMLGGQPPAPGESPASGRTPLLGELSLLVARFGGAGPVRAELDMEPLPADAVTSEVAALTHRIVTEGLTNVRRHAAAAAGVAVAVTRTRAGMLTVTVTDHPPATPVGPVPEAVSRTARGGRGLPELAAAAAALGGVLVAGPHGGGWRLRADLPLRAGSGRRAGGDRR